MLKKNDAVSTVTSYLHRTAGELDDRCPRYLTGVAGQRLIMSLMEFCTKCALQLILCDLTSVIDERWGARLFTVDSMLRRLVAKAVCRQRGKKWSSSSLRLDLVSVSSWVTRLLPCGSHLSEGRLKIDFTNAFDTLCRDCTLAASRRELSKLFHFMYDCYTRAK